MCSIDFTVSWEDEDNSVIFGHEGQFRKVGSLSWTPFFFDINNPKTPFLIEEGDYELRVRIFDGTIWSDWFVARFQIGCGGFTIGFSEGFNS